MKDNKVRWLQDLKRFLPLKSQFILSGNTKDLQLIRNDFNGFGWHRLENAIDVELKSLGYSEIVYYNPLEGFGIPFFTGSPQEKKELFTANDFHRLSGCLFLREKRRRWKKREK